VKGNPLVVDAALSQAVVQLIGKGRSATPGESWAAVESASDTVRRDLEEIMRDYKGLSQIDWASVDNDLIRGMDLFKENFSRLHPELDSAAIDALEWKFSWDWR